MFGKTLPRTPRRRLAVAACLSLAALLAAHAPAAGCSSDYLIWEPRGRSADPLYRFIRGGKAGYIDRSGRVVIEPKFEAYGNYSGVFHDGLMGVGVSSGEHVDATGKTVIKDRLYRGWDFSEGLAAALAENGGKWGYIDPTGKFVISPRFEGHPRGYVSSFADGLARVEASGRHGFIDRSGEFAIRPSFLHASDFSDGMARVVVEGPCMFYEDGPCPGGGLLGGSGQAANEVPPCKFTFVDRRGSVLEERFDGAQDFSEGLAAVKRGGKWGFIDKSGRLVVEPRFDDASGFKDGRALVMQGGLYGFIDERGEFVVPPRYKYAEDFSEGLAAVGVLHSEEPAGVYYIDRSGRVRIPGPFHVAGRFFKGLAHVELKPSTREGDGESPLTRRFAYINAAGKTVFAYDYEEDD